MFVLLYQRQIINVYHCNVKGHGEIWLPENMFKEERMIPEGY